jgi:hypothetical protein
MELNLELALLSDAEAKNCLNGVLKGISAADPTFERLIASPKDMAYVFREIALQATGSDKVDRIRIKDDPKLVRSILVEIAQDPNFRPRLSAWLKTERPRLLEPVTSALVLAGIIMVLSAEVDLDVGQKDGKKYFRISVKKKATAARLLAKFFPFLK